MRLRPMLLAAVVAAPLLAAAPIAARCEVTTVADPDKWIETALTSISAGKTDEFAHSYLKMIDKESVFDSFAASIQGLSRIGHPAFMEKVSDVKFGTALREVMYVALYKGSDYIYFKFTIKKHIKGWLVSNFAFRSEAAGLFPQGFAPPAP